MDQQGLVDRENSVKLRFEKLGGTPEGWLALKDAMRTWSREKNRPEPDGRITPEKAKKAAKWRILESLPQDFRVPSDFVIPSHGFHEQFLEDILRGGQRCTVLFGAPGVGKSTYLSRIARTLVEKRIPVLRHHYYLALEDRSGDRSLHRRVASSLMSDLEIYYPEALGELGSRNPDPEHLGKWLEQCGHFFAKMGTRLVVIVDGLDHVARDKGTMEQVDDLLYHLLPVPDGVTIVLGTQPMEAPNLPKKLLDHAPRGTWKELPAMSYEATREWVLKNSARLGLGNAGDGVGQETQHSRSESLNDSHKRMEAAQREMAVDDLAYAFWAVSDGHPLHLCYLIGSICENNLPPIPSLIWDLQACQSQDIDSYYRRLWDGIIHERGRQLLHLMTACPFEWPESGLLASLDPQGYYRAECVQALRTVKHLTKKTALGLVPFHPSLREFVRNGTDHSLYSDLCRKQALAWLADPWFTRILALVTGVAPPSGTRRFHGIN